MKLMLFRYVGALLRAPRLKSTNILMFILCMAVFAVSAYFGVASMHFGAFAVAFIAGFIFLVSVTTGTAYFNNTPNLVSLFPISPRKSLLYRFLSVLVLFIALCLVMLIVFLAVTAVSAAVVLLAGITDNDVPDEGINEGIAEITHMGVHGGIFSAVYFVFMYFAGMIAGFIKDGKIRNIFIGCFAAAVLAGMILMRNPFIQESYEKMAVPWLCTALCCVAALASAGTAIYIGIKQYNKPY